MTGRWVRWVKGRAGAKDSWKLTRRVKDDRGELTINIEERKMFQTGRKLVATRLDASWSPSSPQPLRPAFLYRVSLSHTYDHKHIPFGVISEISADVCT
jgi:hypothetical protein